MNNFFKFDIKRNTDATLESSWVSINTIGTYIPELSGAENEKEALVILKNLFSDADFKNIEKMSEKEVKDMLL